jgi:RNA polymerase sigma-70 factor (ECF subfamily)
MAQRFETTRWSLILAVHGAPDLESREAMEVLCRQYWFPLYAFVRRRGYTTEESQDLTQEFFTRLIERQDFRQADREKGRFRSFLLGCMKHFLADEWDKTQAQKRGGGRTKLSLDYERAEGLMAELAEARISAEQLYDRQWAQTTLACALHRLEDEYRKGGRGEVFEALKPILAQGDRELSYKALGDSLGLSEGAVKVAVHRMRKRFGQQLQDEIADTLVDSAEVEAELKYLLSLL